MTCPDVLSQVTVPGAHLGPCLLCDQASGQCREQARAGPGVTGADIILYISSKKSGLCEESATLSHAGHCSQVNKFHVHQCQAQIEI